jgi:hypothetical protein
MRKTKVAIRFYKKFTIAILKVPPQCIGDGW